MSKISAWIHASRLRTLPLSSSGVVLAGGLAESFGMFRWDVCVLMFFTANLLQILSNLANDYGDFTKGTDNAQRIGPQRALQSGALSANEMLMGVIALAIITMVVGLWMLVCAFGIENAFYIAIFVLIGASSIWAAIKYTVGKKAYGYYAMGDAFVFVFFGIVAVQGGLFLYIKNFDCLTMLPASGIGLMSVAVLNLNNMRDVDNDTACGKRTLAAKMSFVQGKIYHTALILGSAGTFSAYMWLSDYGIVAISAPILLLLPTLVAFWMIKQRKEFDVMLKIQAITTLILASVFVFFSKTMNF